MRAGKVAGMQIVLNNWFLLLSLIFMLAGMSGKVLFVFGAVLVHELAHALAARALGFKVREIELLPFGGVARIDRLNEAGARSEIIIAAAGPLASLFLAAAAYFFMFRFPYWRDLWLFVLDVNLMLTVFNLIPALPLDGGRILRAWLSRCIGYTRATAAAVKLSLAVSLAMAVLVALDAVRGSVNLTFAVAAVFLFVTARAELRLSGYRTMKMLANKKAELSGRGIMATSHFTVMPSITLKEVIALFSAEQYHIILVVDQDCRIKGALTETEVWEETISRGLYVSIGEILS